VTPDPETAAFYSSHKTALLFVLAAEYDREKGNPDLRFVGQDGTSSNQAFPQRSFVALELSNVSSRAAL
jgi:hypothetical protein